MCYQESFGCSNTREFPDNIHVNNDQQPRVASPFNVPTWRKILINEISGRLTHGFFEILNLHHVITGCHLATRTTEQSSLLWYDSLPVRFQQCLQNCEKQVELQGQQKNPQSTIKMAEDSAKGQNFRSYNLEKATQLGEKHKAGESNPTGQSWSVQQSTRSK